MTNEQAAQQKYPYPYDVPKNCRFAGIIEINKYRQAFLAGCSFVEEKLEKMLGDAFDAGQKRAKHEFCGESRTPQEWVADENAAPDKQKYLSSILDKK